MKELLSALIMMIAVTNTVLAQPEFGKYKIEWSPENKVTKKTGNIINVFGSDDEGFYTLSTRTEERGTTLFSSPGSKYVIDYYTSNLRKAGSKTIDFAEIGKRRNFESMIQMKNDKFYFFTSYLNVEKENILETQLMRPKSLDISSNHKEIHRLSFKGYRKDNSGSYFFKMSKDSSKLLVFYNLPFERNTNEKFGFKVYDQNLKPVWEKEITLPYADQIFKLVEAKIANNGNLYLVGKVFRNNLEPEVLGKPNYDFVVISYRNQTNDIKEYSIKLKNRYITDMKISIDQGNTIVCSGFYSKPGFDGIKGVFYNSIDAKKGTISTESYKEFEIDFLTSTERNVNLKEKSTVNGKEVLTNYHLNEIVVKENGRAVMVAEQLYSPFLFGTKNVRAYAGYNTTYNFNDLIIISISSAGEIDWVQKIDKKQETTNDNGYYSSYHFSALGDKLYFLYNDNERNIVDFEKKMETFTANGGSTNLVTFDRQGNREWFAVHLQTPRDPMIRPNVVRQFNGELILISNFARKQRIGKLKLK